MSLLPTDSTVSATPVRTRTSAGRGNADPEHEAVVPNSRVATFSHLTVKLTEYLTPSELKKVKEAYRFSDEMHLGQMRKSGEPYISHPLAVAEICADWKLDAQAMMAALLH